ncbi:hypothetical protein SDC9_116776 [bioreactor metagenome]|uniref:Uncharacterized protein n=1 Tax=bioreactor metagenome TaxID=1076179 RepID=A0A645BXJ6_9ZZZZ
MREDRDGHVLPLGHGVRLAGAPGDAVHVEDGDGTRLQSDPAAGGEVGQCLVDRLAGGADQLGQLLLGEVVVHQDALGALLAEPAGQIDQGLGDPARHVGEDQVADRVVGVAQPAGQLGHDALGHLRVVLQPLDQILVLEAAQLSRGDGGRGGGPRPRVEDRELAEHLARAEHLHQVLPAGRAGPAELDLAGDDDVELVAAVPLVEEDRSPAQPDARHRMGQGVGRLTVQPPEEGCLLEHVRIHFSSCAGRGYGPTLAGPCDGVAPDWAPRSHRAPGAGPLVCAARDGTARPATRGTARPAVRGRDCSSG